MAWFPSTGRPPRQLPPAVAPDADLLVARQGMSPAFHFYCRIIAAERGLLVVDDRRSQKRRADPMPSREDFWVVKQGR